MRLFSSTVTVSMRKILGGIQEFGKTRCFMQSLVRGLVRGPAWGPAWGLVACALVAVSALADDHHTDKDNAQPKEADPAISRAEKQAPLPLKDLQRFTQAFEYIRSAYVDEVDDQTLLRYAVQGMLEQLDPHSAFLDNADYDALQIDTSGEFGGIGIEVGMEDGNLRIIAPMDDSPAAAAGLLAEDTIIMLDDKSVKGLSLGEAVEKMRGPIGTDLRLMILRESVDKPFEVTLTRDRIEVKSVRSQLLDAAYGYVRIAQFQNNTGREVERALKRLDQQAEGLQGLILDLRNNPGGVLPASVEVVDHFLEEGRIVYTEGRIEESSVSYEAQPGEVLAALPIVILVNGGSASASEIVAGAMQDHGRALILGTKTFGKGSVQTVIDLEDNLAMKLTTARYFTPKGRSIQAMGIEPDIVVRPVQRSALEYQEYGEDNLSGRLGNGKEGGADSSTGNSKDDSSAESHSKDSQLYEALNILKGLALFEKKQIAH